MNITMLGAGSFGTGMSKHLADLGHNILMWTIDKEQSESINNNGRNTFCFRDTILPKSIKCTLDMDQALNHSDRVIMAIPTQFEREVCQKVAKSGKKDIHMLNLAKGIEISTGSLLHKVHEEECPENIYSALSGPSHAEEVLIGCPTAVALASFHEGEAAIWQKILTGNNFRVYTADDVIGLEVGGATKNIYAVAAGISKAMSLGDNALAAIACRGLAEIMRFGKKLGASPMTFSGLAGVGDLMVTCYSMHSRNFRLGLAVGSGKTLDEAAKELGQVAEGAYTVRAVIENSKKFDVEMPLAEGVYRILYANESPEKILRELFSRPLKAEQLF
ncbi:MAG: NAD(P)-dependent glycerol-3-phosphate dehydrogenase [Synergistaceae bacterium]|nr:NAD(P)-dependent glycerol-3-phosphate dehydrogenase [Synergistaceae bacterium]